MLQLELKVKMWQKSDHLVGKRTFFKKNHLEKR